MKITLNPQSSPVLVYSFSGLPIGKLAIIRQCVGSYRGHIIVRDGDDHVADLTDPRGGGWSRISYNTMMAEVLPVGTQVLLEQE
jgi:hypothetical protein